MVEAADSTGPGFILMKIAPGNTPVPLLVEGPVFWETVSGAG